MQFIYVKVNKIPLFATENDIQNLKTQIKLQFEFKLRIRPSESSKILPKCKKTYKITKKFQVLTFKLDTNNSPIVKFV